MAASNPKLTAAQRRLLTSMRRYDPNGVCLSRKHWPTADVLVRRGLASAYGPTYYITPAGRQEIERDE